MSTRRNERKDLDRVIRLTDDEIDLTEPAESRFHPRHIATAATIRIFDGDTVTERVIEARPGELLPGPARRSLGRPHGKRRFRFLRRR